MASWGAREVDAADVTEVEGFGELCIGDVLSPLINHPPLPHLPEGLLLLLTLDARYKSLGTVICWLSVLLLLLLMRQTNHSLGPLLLGVAGCFLGGLTVCVLAEGLVEFGVFGGQEALVGFPGGFRIGIHPHNDSIILRTGPLKIRELV